MPSDVLEHDHTSVAPGFVDLAQRCMIIAGDDHGADLKSVVAGLHNMASIQLKNWFIELGQPLDATLTVELFSSKDFSDDALWEFLDDDIVKFEVRRRLVQLLNSELLEQIVIGSILQGSHNLG